MKAAGLLRAQVVAAVVPAGAKLQAVVGDDPAVLALILVLVGGVDEDVGDPAALLDRQHLLAVGVTGHVDAEVADTGPEPALAEVGVSEARAVGLVDEHVPVGDCAVGGVVVGERLIATDRVVELHGAGDEGPGVGAGLARGRGAGLVPAGEEDLAVVADDPGVLQLSGAVLGIGEEVVDPCAVTSCETLDDSSDRVAVGAEDGAVGLSDRGGARGKGEDRVGFADDHDVPLTVDAFGSVVVGECAFAAKRSVKLQAAVDDSPGVGGRVSDARGSRFVPAGEEDEAVVADDPGVL